MEISTGTIQSMIERKAQEMEEVWEEIGELIKTKAPVKHFDETGMRVEGKLAWIRYYYSTTQKWHPPIILLIEKFDLSN